MRKVKSPDDLSIDELRQLLVEKRRKVRTEHLERFRRTGRVVDLAPELESQPIEDSLSKSIPTQPPAEAVPRSQKAKRVLDRFLLVIEVSAVIGLILIIYGGIKILKDLNRQFAEALTPATLTPTALIVPVVLPSGHTPPNSPSGAQPNEEEIPRHLRPLYQTYQQVPIPTHGVEQATRIQIPAIEVDAPVVQGDGWEELKKGVAQYIGSANPGQAGNLVLSAHNDVFGELFRDLDQLELGDKVIVYTAGSAYTYIVTGSQIVEPTQVEVMAATTDPILTLISCYPYMLDTQRIVVQASLQGWE